MPDLADIYRQIRYYLQKYGKRKTLKKVIHIILHPIKFIKNKKMDDYDWWIVNNEPTAEELKSQKKIKFDNEVKISIIVPVYNPKKKYLDRLIKSIKNQTYSNWELCISDAGNIPNKRLIKDSKKDRRIKYIFLNKRLGISENSNEALKLATGDFIALLDHDDKLPLFSLYEIIKCINENPEVEFIYTDEDKISEKEKRFDPYFKPDFSINTLRSQNYICHFSIFSKKIINQLVGFKKEYDGAQDYDIFLRMTEIANEKNIIHIPKVLYHWRVHNESTAAGLEAKPWAFESGKKAIEDHLKRLNLKGKVEKGCSIGTYKVTYDLIEQPKVSIIIPNKDSINELKICLNSIFKKTTYEKYEIVIVENNSEKDETFDYYDRIRKDTRVKVVNYEGKGFNYSKIINFGVKNSDGEYIIQLNNDTELITPNWIELMLGFCIQEKIGAVGVKLLYEDETVQHAGVLLGMGGIAGHYFKNIKRYDNGYFSKAVMIQDISAVTAACMMTKRKIYDEVGYMNEELAVAFNDIDFCLKIRKEGYMIIYNPYIELFHYESKTRGSEDTPQKVQRFNNEIKTFEKYWKRELEAGDPYYNINLRLDNDQCAIKSGKI